MGSSPSVDQRSSVDPNLVPILAQAGERLGGYFDKPLAATGPRQILGETAGEMGYRTGAMGTIDRAISNYGFSPLETSAMDFTGRTLRGDYLDPTKSPVYQSISDSILRKANEASMLAGDQLNASFAGAGHLGGSGPLLASRRMLAERTGQGVSDTLAQYLMPLYQQNLGYQQNALPFALQLGELGRQMPLGQLGLYNQAYALSGLPRNIEQQRMDELYNYQQRQRAAILEPFQLLTSLLGSTPQATTTVTPNAFERIGLPLLTGGVSGLAQGYGQGLGKKAAA